VTQTEHTNEAKAEINTLPYDSITLNSILSHNNLWEKLKSSNKLRKVEIAEVEKMLHCREGFITLQCTNPNCGATKTIPLSCNSRICTSCGKKYTDKWAERTAKSMFDVPHRHVVMTIASELWQYIKEDRELQKVLMDCAINVFKDVFRYQQRGKKITPAFVAVLHPFGKDLGFRPHVHILVAEGGFSGNRWIPIPYFNYGALRKCWQYQVLTNFKEKLKDSHPEISQLVNSLFQEKEDGFYVRAKDRITTKRFIARYIGRYIRHPAIAESRITEFDGENVKFYYERAEGEDKRIKTKYYKTMKVEEFILAILQHIPERHFKMVRYYGAYNRVLKRKYTWMMLQIIRQEKITHYIEEPRFSCEKCGWEMVIIDYQSPGPPKVSEDTTLKRDKLSDLISA
jgi:hypothetical protein